MQSRFVQFAFLVFAAWICAANAIAQSRTITKAIEIRALSPAEAEQGVPVDLRGIVVFIEGPQAVFLQDESSTTFFRTDRAPRFKVGDEIEVRGKTRMGLYLPGIETTASGIRVVGHRALPAGIPALFDDLVFGRYHYQRVAIEGIVRSVKPLDAKQALLRLAMGSRVMEARVEQSLESGRTLVDHRVRITGLAAGFINDRRQLVQSYVRVIDWSDVEVLAPAPPASSVSMISVKDLLTFRATGHGEQRIGTDGIVTANFSPDQAFLRQGDVGFSVRFGTPVTVEPGDLVTVAGFPEMERFSAAVVDAELVRREPGPPPSPLPFESVEKLADPLQRLIDLLDGELVSVPGFLRHAFRTESGTKVLLAGKTRTIEARLPEGIEVPAVGSRVRITGIFQVESTDLGTGFKMRAAAASLRARNAADITVLEQPSWWTARRLGIVLAAVLGITLIALLWIAILRRQVRRQTEALRSRIESEAALEERQRIAREFHDTLEQELAGVSLRLDALATRPIDDKGRHLVSASRNLVSRIQLETRDLIRDLRDSSEIAGDLAAALRGVAARHAEENSIRINVEATAFLPTLPAVTVHDLRMIAREAITNAIKHGAATEIVITVEQAAGRLNLRITDNGSGFDPARVNQDRRGHFGCAGIRERARKSRAEVTWTNTPPRGTTVEVILSLADRETTPTRTIDV